MKLCAPISRAKKRPNFSDPCDENCRNNRDENAQIHINQEFNTCLCDLGVVAFSGMRIVSRRNPQTGSDLLSTAAGDAPFAIPDVFFRT